MNYRSNIFNGYFYILYTTYIHCIAFCHITLQHSTLHCIHYIHYIHYTHAMHTHIHAYTHTRTHLYGCIDTWTHRRMHAYMQSKPGRNIPVAPSTAQACLKAGQIRRVLERWPAVASLVSYFNNDWGCS